MTIIDKRFLNQEKKVWEHENLNKVICNNFQQ